MRRNWTIFLTLPLALAACVPGAAEYTKTEAPAALHLYGSQSDVILAFAPGSARLSVGQSVHLAQLVRDGTVTPADRVEIAAAGSEGLARARVAAISRELLAYGIVATPRPAGAMPVNRAVVRVGRYAVMLPPCPNWSKSAATDFTNETSSNWGCANAINLGMQVANPADLDNGRTLDAKNGETTVSSVQRYLTDKVIPPVVVQVGPISTGSSSGATPAATGGVP